MLTLSGRNVDAKECCFMSNFLLNAEAGVNNLL